MNRAYLYTGLESGIVALLSFVGGYGFTSLFHGASAEIGGLWALISGIVVLQATRRAASAAAWLRLVGTFVGAIVSATYLLLFPFSALGMAACIVATVLLCELLKVPDDGRLASITVAVIMVVSVVDPTVPPITNATLRFVESCIGTAVGVGLVYAVRRA